MKENSREYWLDLLRIVSCICVILIHLTYLGVGRGVLKLDYKIWKLHIFTDLISQIAVPLFVIISGYLLINNERFKGKRIVIKILKLILLFFLVSVLYSLFNNIYIPKHFEYDLPKKADLIHNIILGIFSGEYHLWFIPMLIGLYALTPIINKIMENKIWIVVILSIWILFNTISSLEFLFVDKWYLPIFQFIYKFKLPIISNWCVYYMIGSLLKKCPLKISRVIIFFGIISLILILKGIIMVSKKEELDIIGLMSNMNLFYILYICGVFLIFKEYVSRIKINRIFGKILILLSNSTFYVYLVHVFFVSLLFYSKYNEPSKCSIRYEKDKLINFGDSLHSLLSNFEYVIKYSFLVGIAITLLCCVIKSVYKKWTKKQ